MKLEIARVSRPTPEAAELIGELEAVLGSNYEAHQRHGLSPAEVFQPHVRFFVARLNGAAVGCAAVALFEGFAEVKRMYTREQTRRHGIGRALLERVESAARAAGQTLLRLETGTLQTAAIGLYERCGFHPCGPFGDYAAMTPDRIEASLFFEKRL
jgi:putative acetyltransferase